MVEELFGTESKGQVYGAIHSNTVLKHNLTKLVIEKRVKNINKLPPVYLLQSICYFMHNNNY